MSSHILKGGKFILSANIGVYSRSVVFHIKVIIDETKAMECWSKI